MALGLEFLCLKLLSSKICVGPGAAPAISLQTASYRKTLGKAVYKKKKKTGTINTYMKFLNYLVLCLLSTGRRSVSLLKDDKSRWKFVRIFGATGFTFKPDLVSISTSHKP